MDVGMEAQEQLIEDLVKEMFGRRGKRLMSSFL